MGCLLLNAEEAAVGLFKISSISDSKTGEETKGVTISDMSDMTLTMLVVEQEIDTVVLRLKEQGKR